MRREQKTSVGEKIMEEIIRRTRRPGIPLPIEIHSAGTNHFHRRGRLENMEEIPQVEICTVARGECAISQGGEMVRLSPGESIWKLPGDPRRKDVLSADGAEVCYVTFDGPMAVDFMRSFGYPTGPLKTGMCPTAIYEEIGRNLAVCSDDAFRRMVALVTELITLLPGSASPPEADERLLCECRRIVGARFADPEFNVDALASESGIHRTTLLRIFKRKLGVTPFEYLSQFRIRRALRLLRETLLPVGEVAAQSGFRQCNHFCRAVRRSCGKTPSEFRSRPRPE